MVGSADSIASPNTTLNAIVAEAFCEAADILEKADDFDVAVHDLIKQYLTEHQRIIFNGNGYSDEWVTEAERRGLPNIKSMIEAASTLTTPKAVALFEKFHIFTKTELESREETGTTSERSIREADQDADSTGSPEKGRKRSCCNRGCKTAGILLQGYRKGNHGTASSAC